MGMSVGMAADAAGAATGGAAAITRLMSEINVTPMVDVMLVLLIIFMVAAPLLTVGVPIDLPDTQAKAMNADTQPITVSINEAGQIYLQETEIPIEELVAEAAGDLRRPAMTSASSSAATRSTDYGTAMKVMARISAAGYKNIGLVSLQEQDQ